MPIGLTVWTWVSSLVLAALLYKPVKNIIYVGRVRKLERKLKRESTEDERKTIEKKTVPLVVVLVVTFSFFFAKVLIGKYFMNK
ncbi:MAG: hypothetical protein V3V59_02255 [Thermodesulfovibrionales bacterium]